MKLKEKFQRFWTLSGSHEGFTLVELIVVIAILAILAGVAIPVYNGYIKKAQTAADQTLLDSINTAFVAACMEKGINHYELTKDQARMPLSSGKVIVANVKPAAIQEAFEFYFTGNENAAFDTFNALSYDQANGMFVNLEMSDAYAEAYNYVMANMTDQVAAVQNSAYAEIGATNLMGAVDDVTTFAKMMISGESGKIFEMVNNEAYYANLAETMGFDSVDDFYAYIESDDFTDEDYNSLMANSTVLSVAKTVNSADYATTKTDLINNLSAGNLSTVIGTITNAENDSEDSLAAAALIYGLYTAYDPDGAREITQTGDFSKIPTGAGEGTFVEYLTNLSDTSSDAYADMEGYFAALEIVNEAVSNDPEVANQVLTNGYADDELVAIIGSIIGG